MSKNYQQPREGFQHGKLYTVCNKDGTTRRLLPDLPAVAEFLMTHRVDGIIRAEHLQGFHIWEGHRERQAEKYDRDLLINLFRLRIGDANRAGIRSAIGEQAAIINQQQYLPHP